MVTPPRPVQRTLVIGWGFIGAAAGRGLLAEGVDVTALTRSETVRTTEGRVNGCRVLIGDAGQPRVLEEAIAGVDHVLLVGGGLPPPLAVTSAAEDVSGVLRPLLGALEAIRQDARIGLTYVSSGGTVYGNPKELPVTEQAPLRPVSPYGASRVAAETYVGTYARTFGIRTRIVRCANVYGPGQPHDRGQGAVAVFLHRVAEGKPVTIMGDGSAQRDFVYIDDVAEALTRLIVEKAEVDVVNLGSGQGRTVMDVVDVVSRVVGRLALLEFHPSRAQDVGSIVLDISRIQSFIDFTPIAFEAGVARTWREGTLTGADQRHGTPHASERDSTTMSSALSRDSFPSR
jgi:UDP-glucose 4-epimerase